MNSSGQIPKKLRKFLGLIVDQLFCIEDNIVVLTESELKKAGFSRDDIQFFLNAMEKHGLYSDLTKRYGFNFLPVPKNSQTKERLLRSWNWQMGFPEKFLEFQYFIKISSRDALYKFCGLSVQAAETKGKTTKNRFKTEELFIESRSQGEDHHILVGDRTGKNEKAHIIVDAKTGEQRVEDGRGEPTDTVPHIETILTLPDGRRVRTTRNSMNEIQTDNSPRPHLDIADFYISGGPDGQHAYFKVINIGKDSALDINYQFKADFYAPDIPKLMHLLTPGDTTRLYTGVVYSSTELADRPLSNIKLALYYQGPGGKHFESGRYLVQEPRADGKFNLSLGGYYE
jgi:hypothetical protein